MLIASPPAAPPTESPSAVTAPRLLTRPPIEAVRAAYPDAAINRRVGGVALVDCGVTTKGATEDCKLISETPPDLSLGSAALKLTAKFAFTPAAGPNGPVAARLRFPVVFGWPDDAPGWTPPDWEKKPTADAIHALWPRQAMLAGVGGVAKMNCNVNVHGSAENCKVVSETPPNMGFGAAALALTPEFLFRPARVRGEPVPSPVVVPIKFESAPPVEASPTLGNFITLLNRPEWTSAPSFAQVGAAYPRAGGGAPGYVALRCAVKKEGTIHACDVLREEPAGKGFARAALSLVPRFSLLIDPAAAALHRSMQVNLPIRLIDPASAAFAARAIGEPAWTRVVDPAQAQALFPREASAKGLRTGVGVASCTIAADGALTECSPRPGRPDKVGFSEAAVTVAKIMQMSLWTQEGGPVAGASVSIPVRFNLAAAAK